MTACEVCGTLCGPLRGKTKSWKCAGVLSHQRREDRIANRRNELRARFSSVEKAAARQVMRDDILALPVGARVLDLYGGGLSAEWILSLRPDLDVWSAERDRSLWPALRRDSAALGYTPVFGDFTRASGQFDFVYLDLCAEPLGSFEAVKALVPMLPRKPRMRFMLEYQVQWRDRVSGIYVTVLRQNRQGYDELRRETLTIAVRALLDEASGMLTASELVHTYPQAGGKGLVDLWRIGPSVVQQQEAIAQRKRWHEQDLATHRWHVSQFYEFAAKTWRDGEWREAHTSRPHAAGTCRCKALDQQERAAERERYNAWERDVRMDGKAAYVPGAIASVAA